jgi:uncharacterized membrane protein
MLAAAQAGPGAIAFGAVVAAVTLIVAARRAPWAALTGGGRLHLLLGVAVVLFLFWNLRAGVTAGLSLHYLGVTAATLILGWELAVFAGLLALAGLALRLGLEPMALPLNLLVTVILPALWTHALWRWVDRRLPRNFFIYVYLCAFVGAAVAALLSALAVACVVLLSGAYGWDRIAHDYLVYLPLLALPEGIINGMIMTLLVALRPHWVRSYEDPPRPDA